MSIIDSVKPVFNFLRSKLITLNLFDTKSTDVSTIRREILSTRLFLFLFSISIFIIILYTSLSIHVETKVSKLPKQIEYEKLLQQYSDTLKCPCTQISILYNEFVEITPSFHQVCSSDFISQIWIDFAFVSNTTFIWPMDVRTSMSAMWQLIASLCQYANYTIFDVFNGFANTPLISSIVFSENLLQIQTQTTINLARQTASDALIRSLTAIHQITQASGFVSGLLTNFITLLPINGWEIFKYLNVVQTRYIQSGLNKICYCQSDRSCPMPGNIYLYKPWETYGLYNLTMLLPNETLPGLITDCLPIQMTLSSSLECFYNQSCFNILLSAYSKSINISILNKSLSSRFLPSTNIEQLVIELFLENLTNKINFKSYYNQCKPIYCTYTISRRFNVFYVITSIIGIIGGLNVALHLISPYLINIFLYLKNRRTEQRERLSIQIWFRNLFNKIKLSIIELNVFNSYSHDINRIRRERFSTRFYIIFLIFTLTILLFYTLLSVQTISKTIQYPSQTFYEQLQEQYPHTLKCPCNEITIIYEEIIEINPIYHQLCTSDFIKSWWYKQLLTLKGSYLIGDFRLVASSYFQMLATFCEIANLTFIHANRRFSSTSLINNEIIPRKLFISQIESLINTFLNSIRIDFTYTLSMIETVLHANQYVTGSQTNAALFTLDFSQLQISSTNPLQIIPFTTTLREDNLTCVCSRKSSCTIPYPDNDFLDIDGIRIGCFIMDSVLQSSLLCWYNQTCFNGLQQSFILAGMNISNNISLLNSTLTSRFLPNVSFQTILQELMVDQWNTSISYENFYQKCRPLYCTYTYEERSSIVFIITTIIGFFGGLNVILRLISPLIVRLFSWFINKIRPVHRLSVHNVNDTTTNHEYQRYNWKNLFSRQIRDKLISLNLFESDTNDINIIRYERFSTRLYIFLLLTIIIIQINVNIILTETKTKIENVPIQSQYERLYILYSNILECPCNDISIEYKEFIKINTCFHQICSSDFISDIWIDFLFGDGFWGFQIKSDLRGRGAAYFGLLSTLCDLSKTTIKNSIEKFLEEIFVNNQILSEKEFFIKINLIIEHFKTNTPFRFSRTLQLLRDITDGNSFVSTYLLNWEWNVTDNRTNATVHTNSISSNNLCSCAKRSDCSYSGGIYRFGDNKQLFSMLGFNVGCSVVETLFQSTFQCLYNQTCIDQLQYYATYFGQYSNATKYINAMNLTYSSRFSLNTTIEYIVNQLFIEQWNINISYESFYQKCSPIYCSYIYEEHHNFLYIFTRILAIYGGLTVALRFITPYLIKLGFMIKKYCHKNTIHPQT